MESVEHSENMEIYRTPDSNRKRPVGETVTPSDKVADGDHLNAPIACRWKESTSPNIDNVTVSLPSNIQTSQTNQIADIVKSTLISPDVLPTIIHSIVPTITSTIEIMLQPISAKLDAQTQSLKTQTETLQNLNLKLDAQNALVQQLKHQNSWLREKLEAAKEEIETCPAVQQTKFIENV